LPEKGFVICSFNNNYKFTPPVFDSDYLAGYALADLFLDTLPHGQRCAVGRNTHGDLLEGGVCRLDGGENPQFYVPFRTDHILLGGL
jgi:hypothetical protein